MQEKKQAFFENKDIVFNLGHHLTSQHREKGEDQ